MRRWRVRCVRWLKALPHSARIRPLPGVHPAVHAEQRAVAEGLLAGAAALIGPLARVDAVVHAER